MDRVLANLMSYSGTLDGNKDIVFPMKAKTLSIYNKSSNKTLSFCFNPSEEFITLDPTEIIEFPVLSIRNLQLVGVGVEYRVVALG